MLAFLLLPGSIFAGGKREAQMRQIAQEEARKAFLAATDQAIQHALRYQDFISAIAHIHAYLALDSTRTGLRDTLSELYLVTGQANQALILAQERLKENPKDTSALQIAALASVQLNRLQEAFNYYQQLVSSTGNVRYMWDFATLLWQMQRYGDLIVVTDQIIQNPASRTQTVKLRISPTTEQNVPLVAAAWNLKGAAQQRLKHYEEAQKSYEEALKLVPDFLLPKQNLDQLKAEMQKAQQQQQSATPASK